MFRLIIIWGLCAFLLISCSPRPIFRLKPQAKQTTYREGIEYVQLQKNGIQLTVSYYRHLNDQFIMDVEIVNETDSLLRVDPMDFSYQAYTDIQGAHPAPFAEAIASNRAINPEQQLLNLDMAIAQEEADQRTSNVLYAIGQTASIAAEVAADTPEQKEQIDREQHESYVYHEINQQQRQLAKASLRDRRSVWELDALRKTDLYPGEYIRGYLFFKNIPDANGYAIRYENNGVSLSLFYLQWKYEEGEVAPAY